MILEPRSPHQVKLCARLKDRGHLAPRPAPHNASVAAMTGGENIGYRRAFAVPFDRQQYSLIAPFHAPFIDRLERRGKMAQFLVMKIPVIPRALAALIALAAASALVGQFLTSQQTHPDEDTLQTLWRLMRFFTILTNGIVTLTFGFLAFRGRFGSSRWLGGVALWIGITGVVYHLLLAGDTQRVGLDFWADFGVHTFVPITVVLWWFAVAPRRGLGVSAAALWMLWPLIYVAYALLRGATDRIYPYFFTDPTKIGWDGVATWAAILCSAFFISGLLQIALARLIHRD